MNLRERLLTAIVQGSVLGATALAGCTTQTTVSQDPSVKKDTTTTGAAKPVEPTKTPEPTKATEPVEVVKAPDTTQACTQERATELPYKGWQAKMCQQRGAAALYTLCEQAKTCKPAGEIKAEELIRRTVGALQTKGNTCPFRLAPAASPGTCGPFPKEGVEGTCCYTLKLKPNMMPVPGRPFLIDGDARFAKTAERDGWCSDITLEHADELPPALRDLIAMSWAQDGCHEHASVASFARFLMQLLGVGAPRDLVEATTRAIDDETRHAHDCFSLASAYAGRTLGPDALDLAGGMEASGQSLAEILHDVILEGCVGETMAAAEASFKMEAACEPAAREILAQIAEEEAQHAELAWRFVAWALAQDPSLHDVARAAFEDAAIAPESPWAYGLTAFDTVALAHGALPVTAQDLVRRQAFAQIVRPAADALLGMHHKSAA